MDYSVWHLLDKLTDNDIKELNIDINDSYSPLPENIVTDGWGNLYRLPKTGSTPLISLENDRYFKYRYNWETSEIEVYFLDVDDSDDANNYSFVEGYGVSPYDFIDNPEYWYMTVAENIEEDTGIDLRDFEIKEILDTYNHDYNDTYNYVLKLEVIIDADDSDDYLSKEEKYKEYVSKFTKETILYGEVLRIDADYIDDELIINISFPLELTKEEIMDIWNDIIENYFINIPNYLDFDIEDINVNSIVRN